MILKLIENFDKESKYYDKILKWKILNQSDVSD